MAKGNSKKSSSEKTQHVSWGELTLYEFPNLLGDNPYCSGSPLTIGWNHESKNVVDIAQFELLRKLQPRRNRKDLVMKPAERDAYLLSIGYKLSELLEASEDGKKIRDSRRANNRETTWNKFMGVFEGAAKGLRGKPAAATKAAMAA